MKRSTKILIAASMAAIMFSIFSGCKSKQKIVRESYLIEKSEASRLDSLHVLSKDSFAHDKIDSSNRVLSLKATKTNLRTLELHFQLDSNRKVMLLDTTGSFDLRQLINRGLASASSLIIKVQDQQSQSEEKTLSNSKLKRQKTSESELKDSTSVKKAAEKKELINNQKEVLKSKDSTVAKNAGGAWVTFGLGAIIIVCASLGLYFLLKR